MILKAEYISKSFGAVKAVDQVSFEMKESETIALLGESGSGKSTLLRIICGLEVPDKGSLVVSGETYNDSSTFKKPEYRKIGLVFQDNALFPHLNVAKNIGFGAENTSIVENMIELARLKGLEKRMPHELSGGQQQRVAIARALATNPDLILLDEPFSTLDHSLKNSIRAQVKQIIQETGKSCIVVTHHMDDATAMADRIAILQDGRIVQIGTTKELYENPASEYVAKLFGSVNTIDGQLVRAEHIKIGEGNLKGKVTEVYFENGHYIVHLKDGKNTIKALSHDEIKLNQEVIYGFTKAIKLP